jgi:hypothetical protein
MDVIGYSNIYRADPRGAINILKPIVKRLELQLKGYNKATSTNKRIKFHQMYGDTLDISFEAGDNDEIRFLGLLDITCMVQKELMKAGLMVRGAILCDDLIDDKHVFTGMAMVEAASMERNADSPHLILSEDAVKMLVSSIPILFPNEKDQEKYLEQTLYEGKKLDCFHHVPHVIPYPTDDDAKTVDACIERIKGVSVKNLPDERSRETAEEMIKGLEKYVSLRFDGATG